MEDPFSTKWNVASSLSSDRAYDYLFTCWKNSFRYFTSSPQNGSNTDIQNTSSKPAHKKNDSKSVKTKKQESKAAAIDEDIFQMDDLDLLTKQMRSMDVSSNDCEDGGSSQRQTKKKGTSLKSKAQDDAEIEVEISWGGSKEDDNRNSKTDSEEQACGVADKSKDIVYRFDTKIFQGNSNPVKTCCFCKEDGHVKDQCPDLQKPSLIALPPMTPMFAKVLDFVCQTCRADFEFEKSEVSYREKVLRDLESYINGQYPGSNTEIQNTSSKPPHKKNDSKSVKTKKQESKAVAVDEDIFQMDDLDPLTKQLRSMDVSSNHCEDGGFSQRQTKKKGSSLKSKAQDDAEIEGEISLSGSKEEDNRNSKTDPEEQACGVADKSQDIVYRFDTKIFQGNSKPVKTCCICKQDGHAKDRCPRLQKPPLIALPPMTPMFAKVLDFVCQTCRADFEFEKSEVSNREKVLRNLESYINGQYPEARLFLFGSSKNGFGFRHSDIDICMTLEGRVKEEVDCVEVIRSLAKLLRKHRDCGNVLAITTAKVPIVKFFLRSRKLEADISLYNTLALENTKMLATYAKLDDRVATLGYTVKVFAKVFIPVEENESLLHLRTTCFADPFNLDHNLSAGVTKRMANYILTTFIRGRERFGIPRCDIPKEFLQRYFFDVYYLTDGFEAPSERNCRVCGKIGHIAKDCPLSKANRRAEQRKEQEERKSGKETGEKMNVKQMPFGAGSVRPRSASATGKEGQNKNVDDSIHLPSTSSRKGANASDVTSLLKSQPDSQDLSSPKESRSIESRGVADKLSEIPTMKTPDDTLLQGSLSVHSVTKETLVESKEGISQPIQTSHISDVKNEKGDEEINVDDSAGIIPPAVLPGSKDEGVSNTATSRVRTSSSVQSSHSGEMEPPPGFHNLGGMSQVSGEVSPQLLPDGLPQSPSVNGSSPIILQGQTIVMGTPPRHPVSMFHPEIAPFLVSPARHDMWLRQQGGIMQFPHTAPVRQLVPYPLSPEVQRVQQPKQQWSGPAENFPVDHPASAHRGFHRLLEHNQRMLPHSPPNISRFANWPLGPDSPPPNATSYEDPAILRGQQFASHPVRHPPFPEGISPTLTPRQTQFPPGTPPQYPQFLPGTSPQQTPFPVGSPQQTQFLPGTPPKRTHVPVGSPTQQTQFLPGTPPQRTHVPVGSPPQHPQFLPGWNCWFLSDEKKIRSAWNPKERNSFSVGLLWYGFLRYYTEEFDFKHDVVCCRRTEKLTKLEKMWTKHVFAIEDPFNLDHNLGAGVTGNMANYIQTTFIRGRERFGVPRCDIPKEFLQGYFFDLTDGLEVPSDRNCRVCGKIGHIAKDCPLSKANRRAEQRKEQEERKSGKETGEKMNVKQMLFGAGSVRPRSASATGKEGQNKNVDDSMHLPSTSSRQGANASDVTSLLKSQPDSQDLSSPPKESRSIESRGVADKLSEIPTMKTPDDTLLQGSLSVHSVTKETLVESKEGISQPIQTSHISDVKNEKGDEEINVDDSAGIIPPAVLPGSKDEGVSNTATSRVRTSSSVQSSHSGEMEPPPGFHNLGGMSQVSGEVSPQLLPDGLPQSPSVNGSSPIILQGQTIVMGTPPRHPVSMFHPEIAPFLVSPARHDMWLRQQGGIMQFPHTAPVRQLVPYPLSPEVQRVQQPKQQWSGPAENFPVDHPASAHRGFHRLLEHNQRMLPHSPPNISRFANWPLGPDSPPPNATSYEDPAILRGQQFASHPVRHPPFPEGISPTLTPRQTQFPPGTPPQYPQFLPGTSPQQTPFPVGSPQQTQFLPGTPPKRTHVPVGSPTQQTQFLPGTPPQRTHVPVGSPPQHPQFLPGTPPQQTHIPVGSPPQQTQFLPGTPAQQTHVPVGSPSQQTQFGPGNPPQQTPLLVRSRTQQTQFRPGNPPQQTPLPVSSPPRQTQFHHGVSSRSPVAPGQSMPQPQGNSFQHTIGTHMTGEQFISLFRAAEEEVKKEDIAPTNPPPNDEFESKDLHIAPKNLKAAKTPEEHQLLSKLSKVKSLWEGNATAELQSSCSAPVPVKELNPSGHTEVQESDDAIASFQDTEVTVKEETCTTVTENLIRKKDEGMMVDKVDSTESVSEKPNGTASSTQGHNKVASRRVSTEEQHLSNREVTLKGKSEANATAVDKGERKRAEEQEEPIETSATQADAPRKKNARSGGRARKAKTQRQNEVIESPPNKQEKTGDGGREETKNTQVQNQRQKNRVDFKVDASKDSPSYSPKRPGSERAEEKPSGSSREGPCHGAESSKNSTPKKLGYERSKVKPTDYSRDPFGQSADSNQISTPKRPRSERPEEKPSEFSRDLPRRDAGSNKNTRPGSERSEAKSNKSSKVDSRRGAEPTQVATPQKPRSERSEERLSQSPGDDPRRDAESTLSSNKHKVSSSSKKEPGKRAPQETKKGPEKR
ncbi:uncharacterized protein LOC111347343, partial [Stylophora pistillata]|uniref:uncharacterized protein LOC111347343 n=1 Tax=Stylophora pistillata TaxID=50429 RepID=UPI000C048BA4